MILLRRARVPAALLPWASPAESLDPLNPAAMCDIHIDGDRIAWVGPSGGTPPPAATSVDVDGALTLPGLVDPHVHLDKAHTWNRAPNRSGTFAEALETLGRDRANWTADDLERRAGYSLRCAWAHGTRVLRTHVDTGFPGEETSHEVMASLRGRWRGRIELQTVPLCPGADYSGRRGERIAALAMRHGASALGGFFTMSEDIAAHLDRVMAIAREHGAGLDLHVDENGNPKSEVLRAVAEAVLRNAFSHPVVCGHCCSLATQETVRQISTIELVREARIGLVALPLCNLYLQDRRTSGFPMTPYWRGLTLIRDFMAAGVPVACASDNVRDAFYAFGDFDPAEVHRESVRLAHLDSDLGNSVRIVTSAAADLVGRPEFGKVAPGAPASLVIYEARSFSEWLSRPGGPPRRLEGERIVTPVVPPLAELEGKP